MTQVPIDAQEKAQLHEIQSMEAQVLELGGVIHSCEAKAYAGMGIGIASKEALVEGTSLIRVPPSLLFTARSAASAEGHHDFVLDENLRLTAAVVQLALQLLQHRGDPTSRWKHYISALPSMVETPLQWSEEDFQELEGSTLPLDVLSRRAAIEADFEMLQKCQTTHLAQLMQRCSAEDFSWALSMVWSRAFWMRHTAAGDREATFIPYVDLCNHNHQAAQVRPSIQGVSVELASPIEDKTQLEISYGDLSNTELLVRYGFVLGENPHDKVPFFLKCDDKDASEDLQAARHQALERHDIAVNMVYKVSKAGLPEGLLTFMRIAGSLDPEALCDPSKDFSIRGDFKAEAVALWSLLLLVKGHLMQYPTSLKEDKALLASKNFRNYFHQLAVSYRVSEKSIWGRLLLCVKREGMLLISQMGKGAAEIMSEEEKEAVGDILTKIVTQPAQVEPAEPELRAELRARQEKAFVPNIPDGEPIDGPGD